MPPTKSPGRPASEFPNRYQVRHDDAQRDAWALAAATCGMALPEWIRATLDGEAAKATHVPMIKREGRRG